MTPKAWLHSILAAAISAAASSVTAGIVDPAKFNFTLSGIEHLGEFALVNAFLAVALILKQSPLPQDPPKEQPK